ARFLLDGSRGMQMAIDTTTVSVREPEILRGVPEILRDREDLERAFLTFNRLSGELQQAYEALQGQVAAMTVELEQARRERELAAGEAERTASRLKSVLATLPAGVAVVDAAGTVREINPAARSLIGDATGESWPAAVRRVFATTTAAAGDWVTRDGRRVTLAASSLAEAGKIVLLTDVTETRALQELAARSQRLSAIGRMAASLAHQIRTPLAGALLYLTQCRKRRDEPQGGELLEKGIERLHHLDRLVQDMLVFARGNGPGERVRVADLFREVY